MKCPKCGHMSDPFATKCPNCGPIDEARMPGARPVAVKPPKPAKTATAEKPAKAGLFAKPAKADAAAKPAGNGSNFLTDLLSKFGPKSKPKPTMRSATADLPDDLSVDEPVEMVGLQASCMKCNKSLWSPSGSNVSADEMVQHSMSRAMFCIICQHTFCKQCAHEAGRKKGTNEFLCPKCGKPLTE